jgi:hypothetical protein
MSIIGIGAVIGCLFFLGYGFISYKRKKLDFSNYTFTGKEAQRWSRWIMIVAGISLIYTLLLDLFFLE